MWVYVFAENICVCLGTDCTHCAFLSLYMIYEVENKVNQGYY